MNNPFRFRGLLCAALACALLPGVALLQRADPTAASITDLREEYQGELFSTLNAEDPATFMTISVDATQGSRFTGKLGIGKDGPLIVEGKVTNAGKITLATVDVSPSYSLSGKLTAVGFGVTGTYTVKVGKQVTDKGQFYLRPPMVESIAGL